MRTPLFLFLTMLATSMQLNAQKLPNKQEQSVWAPSNLKIDGKVDEWGQLQAYNSSVDLAYTIANDDEHLYLVIKATAPRIIEKLLYVGITFGANTDGKKKDDYPGNITISYPQIHYKYVPGILTAAGDKTFWSGLPTRYRRHAEVLTRTDSSVRKANQLFNDNSKYIKVFGIKVVADTLISIYNEFDIKAAGNIDRSGAFVYELSIPLKYWGVSGKSKKVITYNLRLNDKGDAFLSDYPDPVTREPRDTDPDLNSKTDFWGEYTLAKKP